MAEKTQISWTDATWNIARGCTKVNEDCKFCYMMRDGEKYGYDGKVVVRTKTVFRLPLKLKAGTRVFTSSLTDWAHPQIDAYRNEMWAIIRSRPDLTFQMLTKRPERLAACLPDDWWPNGYPNVWLGVSAGHQESFDLMMSNFREIPAAIRWVSLEPLIGEIDINVRQHKIDWIVVGGESGNDIGKWRYRECSMEWIGDIVHFAGFTQTPVFVKQLGTHLAKQLNLHHRHGADMSEWPTNLQVQEFPT